MEVLALRLGSPRELARKIWHLDKFEEEYFELKKEIGVVNQLIERSNDRYKKREAKSPSGTKISDHSYRPKNKKKLLMRKYLELVISLPPLPHELLPQPFASFTSSIFK